MVPPENIDNNSITKSSGKIKAHFFLNHTRLIKNTRNWIRKCTSYYISSLDARPEQLMMIAREHWKIESMHWMLDITFSEDDRHFLSESAHKTLNAMRKYALAVHKDFLSATKKKSSINSNMFSCLLDHNRFLKLLEFL